MIQYKSRTEIGLMRDAGRLLAQTFALIEENVEAGITGNELDRIAEKFIRGNKAEPAFKGYRGYPATICFSLNEAVVHGIPGDRQIEIGDIVSIDVGLKVKGWYADAARTYMVGPVAPQAEKLVNVTREALDIGIQACEVGNHLGDVSAAVQRHAERSGFSVVRELVGHGIGKAMHEDPAVPNFGKPATGPVLTEGMVLAIEPMVNQGSEEIIVLEDKWTVVTADRGLSAHFENTVAITADGPIVLTVLD